MTELTLIDNLLKSTGSTWAKKEDIENAFRKVGITTSLDSLRKRGLLHRYNDYYTLPVYGNAENEIAINALKLVMMGNELFQYSDELLDMLIDDAECFFDAELHIQQRNAVKMICRNGLSILTGGPGTGKTFVLKVFKHIS